MNPNMTDEQHLLIIMCALYLLECVKWIPKNSFVFKSHNGFRFHLSVPGTIFGNDKGGLVFFNPLPPLGIYINCYLNSISISPDAIFSYISLSFEKNARWYQSERLKPLDKINTVEVHNRGIQINNENFAICQTTFIALRLMRLIKKLLSMTNSEREVAIQSFLEKSYDEKAIKKKFRLFKKKTLFLRILCNLFFLYLFGIIPYFLLFGNFIYLYLPLLAIMISFMGAISVESYFINKSMFFSHCHKQLGNIIRTFLYPFAAVRALDNISIKIFEEFDILACASILCSPESFKDISGKILRDLYNPLQPICPKEDSRAVFAEEWYRKEYTKIVERFIGSKNIAITDLTKPELNSKEGAFSYCPRCLTLYSKDSGVCPDCSGINLRPIENNNRS